MRPSRPSSNHGFTLIELMMVLAIMGLTFLVTWPKAASLYHRSQVKAARNFVVNKYNRARIQATQTGQWMRLVQNGNEISMIVEATGIAETQHLDALYGVNATGTTTVRIDPRGLTMLASSPSTIRFSKSGYRDSVVFVGYGGIRR